MISESDEPTVDRYHTAVWTGEEMIVWGGGDSGTDYGARYDPVLDTWTPTSQEGECPTSRMQHAAVWTGTEMIVWGGGVGLKDTGGRYDPVLDSWQATTTEGDCPSPRKEVHDAAVWAEEVNRMFVWGGIIFMDVAGDGALYNPTEDTWEAVSDINAPSGRANNSTVWTGSEVIVWGGYDIVDDEFIEFSDGGHYDPVTDSWTEVTLEGAPSARFRHTAVWTGEEMIVWGGNTLEGIVNTYLADGGRYRCVPD